MRWVQGMHEWNKCCYSSLCCVALTNSRLKSVKNKNVLKLNWWNWKPPGSIACTRNNGFTEAARQW